MKIWYQLSIWKSEKWWRGMTRRVCKQVYDAHMHIPIKYDQPYDKLREEVRQSRIDGGLLIINSDMEAYYFWRYFDLIAGGDLGFVPEIAFILDIHSKEWITAFEKLDRLNVKCSIKIHPRLSNMTIDDFEEIADDIAQIKSDTVIVDNWIYGPNLKNHIGTELTIFLAEKFKNKQIVMAHSGGVRILETMLLTRPLTNVYYDLAETCQYFKNTSVYIDMLHFIRWSKNRIMFGSDYPDFGINHSIELLEDTLGMIDLTYDEIDNIMFANAEKIYRCRSSENEKKDFESEKKTL